jgi:hypothetical protein
MLQSDVWHFDSILAKVLNVFAPKGREFFSSSRYNPSPTIFPFNMLTSLLTVLNLVASSLALVK